MSGADGRDLREPIPLRPGAKERSGGAWYRDGLRFKCVGCECGACCSGATGPGAVWVSREEKEALARHLGMTPEAFDRAYVRIVEGEESLTEKPNNDCVFYEEGKGCRVYDARPAQCRTYPFWGRILKSRAAWEEEAKRCPGISDEAPLVGHAEISAQRRRESRR